MLRSGIAHRLIPAITMQPFGAYGHCAALFASDFLVRCLTFCHPYHMHRHLQEFQSSFASACAAGQPTGSQLQRLAAEVAAQPPADLSRQRYLQPLVPRQALDRLRRLVGVLLDSQAPSCDPAYVATRNKCLEQVRRVRRAGRAVHFCGDNCALDAGVPGHLCARATVTPLPFDFRLLFHVKKIAYGDD